MANREASLLLSPRELKESMTSGVNSIALDVSWHMPNSPRSAKEEFLRKRLPDARFLDLDVVATPSQLGLSHMIPSAEDFASACESFGIEPDTHVILYDTHGVFSAPRALFMFRAFGHGKSSILDGGLPRWEAEGLPLDVESVSSTVSKKNATYPTPPLDAEVVKSYEQVVSNAETEPIIDPTVALVVDARPNGRFAGKDPEPRAGISSGHIPYSFSLPFSSFLQNNTTPAGASYTTFLPPSEIKAALVRVLGEKNASDVINGKRNIVTTCGSGMTACVLWAGLRMLGVHKPGLYDESWTGYAGRNISKIIKDT
ncbi:thiosulfate sulfurtransferase [Phellopilus nigrolimitatus]|nr:thiosulfate sulfurtransferase [Phellopilus nigrolimitatus]